MPKQRCNKRKQLLTFCITMPAASCTSLFLGCVHDTVYRSHLLFCHTYRLSTLAYTHINTQKPELELHPLTASTVNTAAQCAGHWKQKEEVFFFFLFIFIYFFFFLLKTQNPTQSIRLTIRCLIYQIQSEMRCLDADWRPEPQISKSIHCGLAINTW